MLFVFLQMEIHTRVKLLLIDLMRELLKAEIIYE